MKGPLHLIRRRRDERPAPEADAPRPATEAPTQVAPAAEAQPAAIPDAQSAPTTATAESAAAPAGMEPVPERPSFRERGRLRRRLRYLRRVRELGFRDLGGLVFDQHRFAQVNEELVRSKLSALTAVDTELRALERALGDRRPITELREPGISVCPRCGALHGSDARFCPSCGVPVRGPLAIAEVGEAVQPPIGDPAPVAPSAPVGLWATHPSEPESQPAVTEVAEREAAKAQAEAPLTQQPTQAMQPVPDEPSDEQPAGDPDDDGDPGRFARPTGERSDQ